MPFRESMPFTNCFGLTITLPHRFFNVAATLACLISIFCSLYHLLYDFCGPPPPPSYFYAYEDDPTSTTSTSSISYLSL